MFYNIKRVIELFTKHEKRQIYWLLVLVIARSLLEVAGVASIMPFIAVAANPEIINTNSHLSYAFEILGFQSSKSFLLVLGLGVFGVLIMNNTLSAFTEWKLMRFTWMHGHTLAHRLYAKYLSQPYSFFLNRNTAELGVNVLAEVSNFMGGVLRPSIDMVSKSIVSIFLFILLIAIDAILAITVALVLGLAFGTVFVITRRKLKKIGRERAYHNSMRYLCLNESFSGVKEVKVKGCEGSYYERFMHHSYCVNRNHAVHQVVSQMPRYALEVVGFGGILLITIYFILTQQDTSNTIPLIALYALAGYRLMPALQGVFIGITTLRFNLILIDRLSADLEMSSYPFKEIEIWNKKIKPLRIKDKIEYQKVSYAYPNTGNKMVLKSIDLEIQCRQTVGFVGKTGSGKTTLIDLLLGLIEPLEGIICVDGKKISGSNKRSWMRSIGYVPQEIFLSDTSIRENIALGINIDAIDNNAVEKAARIANLDEFINEELPNGYETIVGERGVRLSGGQRQRIGIARALYHDPELIVFDEATSALDNATEKNVLTAINNIKNIKTIVMIAHRLTTLKKCDIIFVLSNGEIVSKGTYEELERDCSYFQNFSNISEEL